MARLSGHFRKRIVVVDGDVDRAVRREDQPLWPALGAAAVEVGLMIDAAAIRQRTAEIAELIAADHMVRPDRAEAAAMPAMRLGRLFRDIPLRQTAGAAQALDGVDKGTDVAQPYAARELAERLRIGALLGVERPAHQQQRKEETAKQAKRS